MSYLHRMALQQGEVKGYPIEEGLAFVSLYGPEAAGWGLAQKLLKKSKWKCFFRGLLISCIDLLQPV